MHSTTREPYKILFQLNQCGYGGTEKAILTFCENLDRSRFTPYVYVYQPRHSIKYYLRKAFRKLTRKLGERFSKKYESPYIRLKRFREVVGSEAVFVGDETAFIQAKDIIQPDIIHFNRGKWDNFFRKVSPVITESQCFVETNVFGYPADDHYHARICRYFFVSHWLENKSPWHANKGAVLYNPIKHPIHRNNIRKELNIPDSAFVFGRITRPDLHDDDFVIQAFRRLSDENCHLILLGATEATRAINDEPRIHLIPPTISEDVLSSFYNTLDTLLHYRIDGETFGMNIAEAMMHGVPVISHISHVDNAQSELLEATDEGEVGFVAPHEDMDTYVGLMARLAADKSFCSIIGNNAELKAERLYSETVVTHLLEEYYETLLNT